MLQYFEIENNKFVELKITRSFSSNLDPLTLNIHGHRRFLSSSWCYSIIIFQRTMFSMPNEQIFYFNSILHFLSADVIITIVTLAVAISRFIYHTENICIFSSQSAFPLALLRKSNSGIPKQRQFIYGAITITVSSLLNIEDHREKNASPLLLFF